jgi:hypothetical protein
MVRIKMHELLRNKNADCSNPSVPWVTEHIGIVEDDDPVHLLLDSRADAEASE